MKNFICFLFLIFSLVAVKAEVVLTLPEVNAAPGTEIMVAVKISGASASGTPFSVADIRFSYDESALTYVGITNFYTAMPVSQWVYSGGNGEVAANWLHPSFQNIAVPDETTLYEVKFIAKPGACDLSFTLVEIADAGLNLLPSSGEDGYYNSIQSVTFQVDMRDQTVGGNGVHLAGSFNNWNTSSLAMTASSGTVYSVTQTFLSGSYFTFRHVNGNLTTGYELVPSSCGVPATGGLFDRSLTVPAADTVLPAFCFSSCDSCPPLVNIDFRVDMAQQTISPNGVHIAGDFNNWSTTATPLTNLGSNVFGVTVQVIPGSTQQYKFVNGNSAAGYELVPSSCGVSAGGGLYNRQIQVLSTGTILDEVCFSSCDDCPNMIEVTMKVDMSQVTVSPAGVYVAGSFNNFSTTSNPMINQGNNVYKTTIEVIENDFITYRFVNGNTPAGFENVPETCGISNGSGGYNRYLQLLATDTTLAEVCFASCTDCVTNPGESEVVFKVDMSQQVIGPEGVYLAGSFNNWNTTSHQMTFAGDGVYTLPLIFNEGTVLNYKFINGDVAGGYETVPASCGQTGTTGTLERILTVPVNDTTLAEVCFSSCEECPSIPTHEVTFRLNMDLQVVSPMGIHLASSFNNWSPSSDEMVLFDGYYQLTKTLPEGVPVRFRYVNGNTLADLETVPAECGVVYSGNERAREFISFTSDTLIIPVCLNKCGDCFIGIDQMEISTASVLVYPNPASGFVNIVLPASTVDQFYTVELIDLTGRKIFTREAVAEAGKMQINIAHLEAGVYTLILKNAGKLLPDFFVAEKLILYH